MRRTTLGFLRNSGLLVSPLLLLTACPGDDTSVTSASGTDTDSDESSSTSNDPSTTMTTTTADSSSSGTDPDTSAGPTTADSSTTEPMESSTTDPTDTTTGDLCGNGAIDEGEECDGDDLGGEDCVSQNFDEGTLACADDCTFDTAACVMYSCGNDAIEGKEVCDGTDLGGADCVSEGFPLGGELGCAANCGDFDTTGCITSICGNGAIEGAEACDGDNLNDQTCVDLGYFGGQLACAADCASFDESGCEASCVEEDIGGAVGPVVTAGNTVMEDNTLDGSCGGGGGNDRVISFTAPANDSYTFDTFGSNYDTKLSLFGSCDAMSELVCNDDAGGGVQSAVSRDMAQGETVYIVVDGFNGSVGDWVLNISVPSCGDGIINGSEVCDGGDLGGQDCFSQGYLGGTLGCAADCGGYDVSQCLQEQVTQFCVQPNQAINDNQTTTSQLNVAGLAGTVTDINVSVTATHTWVADVSMSVTHVDTATASVLFNNECGSANNIDVTLDQDAGPFACTGGDPAIGGTVQPADGGNLDTLAAGVGNGNGTWELAANDNAGGDIGTVSEWCLDITSLEPVGGAACGADPVAEALAACQATFANCEIVDGGVVGHNGVGAGANCSVTPDTYEWRFYCTEDNVDNSNYNCSSCSVGEVLGAHNPCNCNDGTSAVLDTFCGGGALYWAPGVQVDVAPSELVGWTECFSGVYANNEPNLTADILGTDCTGDNLLMACRPVGQTNYTTLAMAPRADVLFDTGNGNVTHSANGVEWYYNNNYSMGFAQGGDAVSRNSCDTENTNADRRLCWHTGGDAINGGWRCGATTGLNGDVTWERKIFQSNGGGAVDPSDCANNPQWMPVDCTTASWVWSSDRTNADTLIEANDQQVLWAGCAHAGDAGSTCSLDGTGWVSVDTVVMAGCNTDWYHLGGSFTGDCGGHDGDIVRRLALGPNDCYAY